jgi:ribosomal protein S18 acetylase RimI-like enzyme
MDSSTPWTLRPATPADHDFLFNLHRGALGPYVEAVWGWDEEEQLAIFDARFAPERWQIVRSGDADVGVLILVREDAAWTVSLISLLPEWQGRGIGSSLLRTVLDEAAASDRPVLLRVLHANPRARAFYERLGFACVDEIETHAYMRWDPPR